MNTTTTILQAALIGFKIQRDQIDEQMRNCLKQLRPTTRRLPGGSATVIPLPGPAERVLSAGARSRIAAAQKKRWANYRAKKAKKATA